SFRVEEIHRRETRKTIARERQFSLPHGLAAAAAVLRALPGDAHAAAKIGGRERTRRLHDVHAMQHIEALNRRGADDLDGEPHRHQAGPDDVAHRQEKPVFIAGYKAPYGKKLLITGSYAA